ncbi:HAAS signaling domain-containing protein [Peribacillus asahii]|uniref:HAAS signaling domain-containing protein n=1 Tax=Peribacillus asahii TaxID=228899 RepID=UPI002079FF05|nr:DUF1700 domain-containing protein [Peribacillus asahii]USK60290.1 DUF1700 domain-containing protein [Peribacillus asahii]
MNKEQFLHQLQLSLRNISIEERQEILQDYEEYFAIGLEEGKTEEEISKALGSPKQIAKELVASAHIEKVEHSASAGNIMRAVWAVIGLGFFNLVIVLGPFIGLVALLFAGWVVSLSFILSPLGVLFNMIMGDFWLFDVFSAIGLCGIGIFVGIGMLFATKALTKGFIRYLQFNVSLVKGGLKHE